MRVLIPIDFSPSSDAVVQEAETRPWPPRTEVALLHVVDIVGIGGGWVDLGPRIERQTEQAAKLLKGAAERLREKGLKVSTEVVVDHPANCIPKYAQEHHADLILIGPQGQSALLRFLMGSVAKSVLRNAPCSVEVVRPCRNDNTTRGTFKVLLATDGSACSHAALAWAAAATWPKNSEFRVITCAESVPLPIEPWVWYADPNVMEELQTSIKNAATVELDSARKVLQRAGLEASGAVIHIDPKSGILDEAEGWGADLIVLGSHGRRGLDRLLLGSVAEAVALHSKCSVAVIRSIR